MSIKINDLRKMVHYQSNNGEIKTENISYQDIAVIGMDCRIASANSIDEYWNSLINAESHIRKFPAIRCELNKAFLESSNFKTDKDGYYNGGFLDEVHKFDNDFFSISPFEAKLMDPNQRLFLQCCWSAIENAGYNAWQLGGKKIGVFLGHSTDFGIKYKEVIEALDPENVSFSISGNLNSIIASRISYILDFKGPSVLIDTACSSSLVAIHHACQSIRRGECESAIVGAIKLDLFPLISIKQKEDEIGITSPDGVAKTFDDETEGTGLGEGVGAVFLKPLKRAMEDNDHIYAVIKGSAINQDGRSANLTAPNPYAQHEVIINAWKDAGVHPESISYVEAHGTGTKLGDVIEISGLNQAFKKYTEKKQFCAIGSVKTNIGHLDNLAGIAGFIKVVLALNNKIIPPSIHFTRPNRKINFEESPFFVNDIQRSWETSGYPRRAGISAFGLSGTNCHLILEEFPQDHTGTENDKNEQSSIITISADYEKGVYENIWKLQRDIWRLQQSAYKHSDIENLCYTLNTGRGHYAYRLAIVFNGLEELYEKLERIAVSDLSARNKGEFFYGKGISASDDNRSVEDQLKSERGRAVITFEANDKIQKYQENKASLCKEQLKEIALLYVAGADIDWQSIYSGEDKKYKRIAAPTYPFREKSYWIGTKSKADEKAMFAEKEIAHPLLNKKLVHSMDTIVYNSYFDTKKDWILNEHKVAGTCVIPGTVYIELILEVIKREYAFAVVTIKDVLFLMPLALKDGEIAEVHTEIKKYDDEFKFFIASKTNAKEQWQIHAEGKIIFNMNEKNRRVDYQKIIARCTSEQFNSYSYKAGEGIETSKRWDSIRNIWYGAGEAIAHMHIDKQYKDEVAYYNMHPALLDEAVNLLLRNIGEGLYLPFSYKNIIAFKSIPGEFYCYVKLNNPIDKYIEIQSVDIELVDINGEGIASIKDYRVKRTEVNKIKGSGNEQREQVYRILWEKKVRNSNGVLEGDGYTLIFKGDEKYSSRVVSEIRRTKRNIILVSLDSSFEIISDNCFNVGRNESSFRKLFEYLNGQKITEIVYLLELKNFNDIHSIYNLQDYQLIGVGCLFFILKAMAANNFKDYCKVILVGYTGYEVSKDEHTINPMTAALFGLGKVIHLENPKLLCRCIDIDEHMHVHTLVEEIFSQEINYLIAYRHNERYIPLLDMAEDYDLNKKLDLKEDGVYVVTGGLGGIGLEVAKCLSSNAKVNIALLSRSPFPSSEHWKEIIERQEDHLSINRIDCLKNIISNGCQIEVYNVDISDIEQTGKAFHEMRQKYGRINGIFHCAGVAGNGFLAYKDESDLNKVLNPKTIGTWVLDRLTENDDLDYFVLFSSTTALFPEAGLGDYVAANCFLDSFVNYRRKLGKNAIGFNWAAWKEIGMAVNYKVDFSKEIFHPITNEYAMSRFCKLLKVNQSNNIVGHLNYNNFLTKDTINIDISKNVMNHIMKSNVPQLVLGNELHNKAEDVMIKGREGEPVAELERTIASIIAGVLDIREISIYDDFGELGGNSIIAVKVEMEMDKHGIGINSLDLYTYKNAKNLAEYIRKSKPIDGKGSVNRGTEEGNKADDKQSDMDSSLNDSRAIIIDGIKPFNKFIYKGCFYSSLFPALMYFNAGIDCLLINDIIVFDETVNDDSTKFLSINYIQLESIESILRKQAIEMHTFIKCDELVQMLHTSLQQGKPVIVCVDCYYEPYRKDKYNKEHWPHSIMVYGYHSAEELFYIIEHQNSESPIYKKCTIGYLDLVRSYNGYFENYLKLDLTKSSFNQLVFSEDEQYPTYFELGKNPSLEVISQNHLMLYTQNMIEKSEVLKAGIEKLKNVKESYIATIQNEELLNHNIEDIIDSLNIVMSAKKIEEYRISMLFKDASAITEQLNDLLTLWNQIRTIIVRYSFSKEYDKRIGSTVELFEKLCLLEETFCHDYIEYLQEFYNGVNGGTADAAFTDKRDGSA